MNSAAGSFGLSFGLAVAGAIMLASLAIGFTQLSNSSTVLSPDQQTQVATALESDAQIVSDTQLQEVLAGQPEATQAEILRINDQAREVALQVALLVPIIAGVLGFANAFWMVRTPEPKPSAATEGMPRLIRAGRSRGCVQDRMVRRHGLHGVHRWASDDFSRSCGAD